ncbi:uncharacterized protein B0H18DRAFT_874744 [Fomitopsis serialis]|uniref:uncharacterized protein n=1 Tax=Fomitopsis serialis TaxID=139415 RepID=UPI002007CFA7|nr:uncharacterized protein B0H18DRAFT_874744 [Neoantrodia serialis]KAH9928666.1 hypothetical protein B0H18DRAFT_874744 [Neoantrodia serialis]
MPRPAQEDIIDLTYDSEPENAGHPAAAGPRHNEVRIPPLSAGARQQLYTAIETCPEDKLRDVLANMVADDAVSAHALFENLVAEDRLARPRAAQGHAGGAPEMISRWATCLRCGEDFDVAEEREEDECMYHPGTPILDEEGFPDHDEDVHGPMDTPENRESFPESFFWSCCKEDGRSHGCTEGTHVPEMPVSKKRRTRY